ncbi:IS66 family insertion sequence element accessory protein TnpB [Caballeronia sp. PC1]|uniref:IS66 family insertion sequence element accessory protein TnpB n=1 Tax=Caballeronia sp. PC1 TaxID=2906765 RepID=UPI001F2CC629|nr:IS66 family insertion sequence element accessory protein TnpB [Caballeronia sp. PC1]MCE4547472.1 IS66 family insertion sequence element accessory protein TnpB [Caballeronia sp. PC1]
MAAVIRVDEIWLAVDPLDMRAGFDTALARVVKVFGAAHPHHAYLFTSRRANRLKVLVHDGIGIWLAARRLNQGSSSGRTLAANQSSKCSRTNSWRAWCWGCRGNASAKMA